MKNRLYLIAAILFVSTRLAAQPFEKTSANISFNNYFGYLVLADLDNDGDPEVIQTGLDGRQRCLPGTGDLPRIQRRIAITAD